MCRYVFFMKFGFVSTIASDTPIPPNKAVDFSRLGNVIHSQSFLQKLPLTEEGRTTS